MKIVIIDINYLFFVPLPERAVRGQVALHPAHHAEGAAPGARVQGPLAADLLDRAPGVIQNLIKINHFESLCIKALFEFTL